MAARDATEIGRFHFKCSSEVNLSEDGKTAWTGSQYDFGIAFSKDPIPRGRRFSIKVVEPEIYFQSVSSYCKLYQYQ